MNDSSRVTKTETLRRETVAPIVREAVIIVAILVFTGFALLLPGTGQEIPGTSVAIGDLILALGSLGIAASLLWVGPNVREVVVTNLEGPADVITDAASIARNLAAFVAVLVLHRGFAPVLVPLLEVTWVYDIGFLLVALIPLGVIAYRLYNSVDPLSAFLTTELLGADDAYPSASTEEHGWS